jgi:protein-S-isoprenylcysteine O-methyltransferase Ste14
MGDPSRLVSANPECHVLAQGAIWLVLPRLQWTWAVFFAAFVGMQLYRARVEEGVLEDTFGETYRVYKRRTFWFM